MQLNKLRVGVLLENYKKETGGGYFYYNTLVEGIAGYAFHPELEFVFISFDKIIDKSVPEGTIWFDAVAAVKKKYAFFSFLNTLAKLKGISYLPLSAKIQDTYKRRINEKIKEKLIEHEIDILYSLTPYYNDLDYPAVVTHWDIGHKSTFAFPEVTYAYAYESRELFYKKYLQKAFAIICESEAGKKELCTYKNINPDRVFVLPMFAGGIINMNVPQEEQDRLLEEFTLTKNNFFLYPAQFWAHKNHYNLLLAFEKIAKKYPAFKLVLPGSDKGNLAYIKQVTQQLGVNDQVVFAGFISNEELYTFYRNAISVVMPTLMGPTNMPPIEAQALGCKVICSDFPGHRESLGEQAVYIDPVDTNAIAAAMEDAYLNKHSTTPSSSGIKNVDNSLSEINAIFTRLKSIRRTFGR